MSKSNQINQINNLSWGRYPKLNKTEIISPNWASEIGDLFNSNNTILPYGNGRSYGDSCLNSNGQLIKTNKLNHFIHFDKDNETITAEAGITLDELIRFLVPNAYFLYVLPGTKYITLGGAIANDIHGKNHHSAGSFGNQLVRFELVNENGRFICSKSENPELFRATIGGLGLTGIITWAEIKVMENYNSEIYNESIKFYSLEEFFEINEQSTKHHEYTVAWLDISSDPKRIGRGIYMRANHVRNHTNIINGVKKEPNLEYLPLHKKGKNIPFTPELINNKTIDLFNKLYFDKQIDKNKLKYIHYDKYFFPLDGVGNWNKLYGKNGFIQYQFVLPFQKSTLENIFILNQILNKINKGGFVSFLTVLKTFGEVKSLGLISFPKRGITLAIDFKIDRNFGELLKILDQTDKIITELGGAIYIAKDARMSSETFKKSYPNWQELLKYKSPNLTSDFWERVMK